MAPAMLAHCDERTQERNNGTCPLFCYNHSCPSIPHSETAAQSWSSELVSLSLSLCIDLLEYTCPLSHPDGIPVVHSQMIWGLFFLALMFWNEESSVGLGPLVSQGASPHLIYPSQFLIAACGCGTSLFIFSTPSTSLIMASLYSYLYVFCSASL